MALDQREFRHERHQGAKFVGGRIGIAKKAGGSGIGTAAIADGDKRERELATGDRGVFDPVVRIGSVNGKRTQN